MPKCDFCNVELESFEDGWKYETAPGLALFPGLPIGMKDDGGWLACDACAEFIEADDKKGLENRAVELFTKSFSFVDRKQARLAVQLSHGYFWENKKSEVGGAI